MFNKTYSNKQKNIKQNWHFFDGSEYILGKLSSDIAILLIGKHKPSYSPYLNNGDKVVVTNCKKIKVTGQKEDKKIYNKHTGNIKGHKQTPLTNIRKQKPEDILRLSIKGMLPKNKLRKRRLANLYIYEDENHPHEAQK